MDTQMEAASRIGPILTDDRYRTDRSYVEEILEEHFVPFSGFIGKNFVLMLDNAKPHTAAIERYYLAEVKIPVMAWPA
ncbi:unnamed protein product [Euphydryas editha]|uniref:Tc1-like transposase DDE domain-containing protein n=1 Tax=Euphydryas editha TaxID=104508 RepID=A0AAU9TKY3_EUPED|nr:unnamed protein product [Euphydryas editha]